MVSSRCLVEVQAIGGTMTREVIRRRALLIAACMMAPPPTEGAD